MALFSIGIHTAFVLIVEMPHPIIHFVEQEKGVLGQCQCRAKEGDERMKSSNTALNYVPQSQMQK